MKGFIRAILVFIFPIIFAIIGIEFMVRHLPNSYKTKTMYLKAHANSIETLILGSSHTFYGVNPEFVDSKTFNAGNVSQSPDIDLAILQSYEDDFNSLKTVVIRLSYDTLFEQLLDSPEDWRLKDYKLYTDVKFDYKFIHNSEILSAGARQVFKILKDYYLHEKPLLNCDSLGWGNDLEKRLKPDLYNAGKLAAERHTIDNWDILAPNIKAFKELNEWCKKRDVKVLLITPPAFKSYINNLDKDQLNKMIQVGNELNLKFDNCTYYNFMAHDDFTNDDFYDGDHLNAAGAKKFSLIINGLIEN